MELLAVEDDRAVLTAEEELSVTSGSLTVDARALGGLGQDLAILVQVLNGVALVLGALGHNDGAILERNSHTVVSLAGLEGLNVLWISNLVGWYDLCGAVTIGEERGEAVVVNHVACVRCLVLGVVKLWLSGVVVVVIAVRLGDEAGVEGEELVALGHHDVTVIASVRQAQERRHILFRDDLAGLGIVGLQATLVGENDAIRQLGNLSLALAGFHAVVGVVMSLVLMIVSLLRSGGCRSSLVSWLGAGSDKKRGRGDSGEN